MTSSTMFRMFVFAFATAALAFTLPTRANAQTLTTLATFDGTDGYGPYASVVQATDGNFYGITNSGGNIFQQGTLFRVTPAGELTDLYNFCSQPKCADGAFLSSVPILASDGNLYGVTGDGGNTGNGTVYRMTLGGKLTTLYSFCAALPCPDGSSPTGLVQGSGGNFYGTTSTAANANGGEGGTIFSMSPTGKLKTLYTFCSKANCMDGDFSFFAPILGNDDNLYGVTYFGGNQQGGLLWQLTAAGAYKVLYNFCGKSGTCKSSNPFIVTRDSNGDFFGTTASGGANNAGVVFEITSTGQYIDLHDFDNGNGPTWPFTGLTLANDGNLYGVSGGGSENGGFLFEITLADHSFKNLYVFDGAGDASEPPGPLFQGTDGNLYGTTTYGPGNADGMVFRLSNSLSPLIETVPTAGKVGKRILILGNNLTGTTSVAFNGVPAEFTVEKDTFIRATVPEGATTGTVSVVTPSGTLDSNPQFVATK
ncbi:MAG: choice-of-anchor tandem repeat GloVer-containing protein [Candidatus Sulfotelmatobacter sp.]